MPLPPAKNFYELFAATAGRCSTLTAVEVQRREGLDRFTYAELEHLVVHAAFQLSAAGIARNHRCAILAENDAYWCAAYLGVLRLGAVAVPLDTGYSPAQVATLVRDCGARALWVSRRHEPVAREALRSGGLDCKLLHLSGAGGESPSLEELRLQAPPAVEPCPAVSTDRAVILYTSGTTSDPKGVVLTHGNLIAEATAVFQVVRVNEKDCILGVLPLFHALALMANLLLPLTVGARVVFLETLGATELLQALREREATLFACVPQFFYLIHERVQREVAARSWPVRIAFRALLGVNGALRSLGVNLGAVLFRPVHRTLGPRMRLLVTGGSRFDVAVGRDFYRMGFDLLQAYGLTECSGAATVMRPGESWTGSVGRALPGVEIRILPREGGAEEAAADGEVVIRGPIVMEGYHNRPDVNSAVLREGWLHTGDLGRLDRGGHLFITGRQKEIIVTSGGKNIYPEEIEAHYRQSAFIKDICVVGMSLPGERAAERLHAVVVPDFDQLRQRQIVNVREIIRFEIEGISIHLPSYKRVLGFDIWTEDLPRTSTRKLRRFEIERRVRAQAGAALPVSDVELSEAEAVWAAEPEVARALGLIAEAARRQPPIRPDANLDLDLGLDSMQRVELITRLEQTFGVALPEAAASQAYTVRELIEAFRTGGGARAAPSAEGDPWARLLAASAPPDAEVEELLRPRRLASLTLFIALKIVYALAWVFLRFRVSGREHLPAAGPFVLSPNHQSYIDAFLLSAALPYRLVGQMFFVGASEFFETPLMRFLARQVRLVPVDPDRNLVRAMQAGAYGLRRGGVLILFPEGERSPDGSPKRFKKGASILSLHLRVPIVPVGLEGAFDVWPRGKSPQRLARVRMRIGPPLPPPEPLPQDASLGESEARYASAAEQLRQAVVELWESLRHSGAQPAAAD